MNYKTALIYKYRDDLDDLLLKIDKEKENLMSANIALESLFIQKGKLEKMLESLADPKRVILEKKKKGLNEFKCPYCGVNSSFNPVSPDGPVTDLAFEAELYCVTCSGRYIVEVK